MNSNIEKVLSLLETECKSIMFYLDLRSWPKDPARFMGIVFMESWIKL